MATKGKVTVLRLNRDGSWAFKPDAARLEHG